MSLNIEIMGHRGNKQFCDLKNSDPSYIRENSLEAFYYSLIEKQSCHYIETDLRLTKDKKIVIIHDNDLRRCYNIDIGCNIDQAESSLLIEHGVPTFKQFIDWYLYTYGKDKKVILDIKAVVPIEILLYVEKEILEQVKDKDLLMKIQASFVLGLWLPTQSSYIEENCPLLAKFGKINITLSTSKFINNFYKPDFGIIGCSMHYLNTWDKSSIVPLFEFLKANKDIYNNDHKFLIILWTVNDLNTVNQTLKLIKDTILETPDFDGFNTLKIALCTDNPDLMYETYVLEDIFNKSKYNLSLSNFEINRKIWGFKFVAYLLYSKWFRYEVMGFSFMNLCRKITGI
ncbi:uncharacterized protein HGUI_02645 [Hanseniaspora guilliermondii]|uniref:GP-PDE domain-containing protein n=1 Tax=Hanseniaspora guilliermondii TaxID=56406 RepID=A0A1L0CNH6_9ASCO|nr:uncharacterized protein HGUI_02645 [Hanseniaspora guilliermondii]